MKSYVIVTNDALELPIGVICTGAAQAAATMGISVSHFRKCLCWSKWGGKYKSYVDYEETERAQRVRKEKAKIREKMKDRSGYFKRHYAERKAI